MNSNNLKQAVLAGLLAGALFLVLEMILVPLVFEGNAWGPSRMIAGIVMGEQVVTGTGFNVGVVLIALLLHFALSVFYAIIIAYLSSPFGKGTTAFFGGIVGFVIYLINFYLLSEMFFPWFAEARNWLSALVHVLFGGVAGYTYKALRERYEEHCVTC